MCDALKPRIEMATSLPVSAPDEPELALARGAALASANAPRFEASTVGLGYSQDPDGTTAGKRHSELDAGATHVVGPSDGRAAAVLACSTAPDDNHGRDEIVEAQLASLEGRKPFLLAGSALTSVFVLGVVALLFSLAVSSRLTVDQRPNPAEGVTVPSRQAPASAAPEAAVPTPAAALPAPTATARVLAPPAPARPPVVVRNVAPAPVAPPPPAPVLAPPVPIIQLPGFHRFRYRLPSSAHRRYGSRLRTGRHGAAAVRGMAAVITAMMAIVRAMTEPRKARFTRHIITAKAARAE